ncbi:MBL fold metallo-hydrolase [Aerophototrophica crusticola]|uniref:MBL fold metallo-hydrolase n=2 Tax=Aerophototrophica crusticola TaxID=1709002 RepID=A0A858RAT5_9PROT|nr:MBL fold metallo-hydrolase [Rhodospirillaceae bacterium B3]
MPLPFALDHVNLWLLRDGEGWAVVDTGISSNRTRAIWETVFAQHLGGLPVSRVIVTHFHPDHLGLAGWITERFGVGLWMTRTEWLLGRMLSLDGGPDLLASNRRFHEEAGLTADQIAALEERGHAFPKGVPSVPAGFTRMVDGGELRIGDHTWRVTTAGGHAPEHACLTCADLGLFIAGDMVLPRISPNVSVWPSEPEADPLSDFLEGLAKLKAGQPDSLLVLPSHGLPFHGLHARIDQLAAHHQERLEEVVAACRLRPTSVGELTGILFRRPMDAHQLSFAVGEALAHLNHLLQQGRLSRERDSAGVLRNRAA